MVVAEDVRRLALPLPRAVLAVVRGQVKFRVGSIVFLALSRDETMLGFAFPKEERADLVASRPDTFVLPVESDLRYHWLRVRLAALDEAELRELVLDAWRMVVPKKVVAAYERSTAWLPSVRLARSNDVPALVELARASFEPYVAAIGRPPAPMSADYAALVAADEVWVAEAAGVVVGLVVLRPDAGYLLLDSLAVAPDVRAAGIGGLLIRHAEAVAAELGLPEVRLCTNEKMVGNLAYYRRRGFVETHRAVQDGYQRVFFTRRLPVG